MKCLVGLRCRTALCANRFRSEMIRARDLLLFRGELEIARDHGAAEHRRHPFPLEFDLSSRSS